MRVATTCNGAGYMRYGYTIIESWKHWPADAELYFYVEGFAPPEAPSNVVFKRVEHMSDLQEFKERHKPYVPPQQNFLFDVVRFSHKVYAAVDAFMDYDGLGVWMDADCITFEDVDEDWLRAQMGEAYIAHYARPGLYTETGMWLMNCAHPYHRDFLNTWISWYTSDSFKSLSNWTDCETLDATIRKYVASGLIKTTDLGSAAPKTTHPMEVTELGKRISHRKGDRKDRPFSPENKWAAAAFERGAFKRFEPNPLLNAR